MKTRIHESYPGSLLFERTLSIVKGINTDGCSKYIANISEF